MLLFVGKTQSDMIITTFEPLQQVIHSITLVSCHEPPVSCGVTFNRFIVVVVVVVVVVEKKFSLTLPWVVLFSDSGLYQSSGSLRVGGLAPFLGGRFSAAQPH